MEGQIDPSIKNYVAKTIQREMLPIITRQFGQPDQVKAHNDKMNKLLQVVRKMPAQDNYDRPGTKKKTCISHAAVVSRISFQ